MPHAFSSLPLAFKGYFLGEPGLAISPLVMFLSAVT